jgi:glutamate/tyrosine decarboxylase-like PLP-dependent enzyme
MTTCCTLLSLPADKNSPPTGTDCVGSSEAVLLGGLALKRRWQVRCQTAHLNGEGTCKTHHAWMQQGL